MMLDHLEPQSQKGFKGCLCNVQYKNYECVVRSKEVLSYCKDQNMRTDQNFQVPAVMVPVKISVF